MKSTPFWLAILMTAASASRADSQAPVPLKPLPAIQLEATQTIPGLDGQRFSLGFSQPTPIRDVLLLLVRDTRFSLVPSPSLDQRFIGDLKNVTLREALDLILEPLSLDYSVRGQVIRVFPRELETRFYSIDHVITQRTASRSIGGVTSTDAPDVFGDISAGVRALLSNDGRMNLDRTSALLQVTDRPARLARVEQYIETAMLRVLRQIHIEGKVIQIELNDESPGLDWPSIVSALPRSARSAGAGSAGTGPAASARNTLAISSSNVSALLGALAAHGTVTVLATPILTAMNNEPAVVRVGTTAETPTEGVSLTITSHVGSDGVIHMSVGAMVAGRAVVRETDNVYRVRPGETAVIAGLMHASVPRRTDVVILLTPTIVQTGAAG